MAVKYYSIPEQGKVVAVLNNTSMDAMNKIYKICSGNGTMECCIFGDKYMMPDSFRAVAKVHADDVFDEEVGKKIAKEKLMKAYYASYDSKIDMFVEDMHKILKKVS